jgi:hypothetical protein
MFVDDNIQVYNVPHAFLCPLKAPDDSAVISGARSETVSWIMVQTRSGSSRDIPSACSDP